jgi:hypothetical protein
MKIVEDRYDEELGVSLMDFICYQNSRSSLNEIKTWLGEVKFLEMLNLFAGSYLLIPPTKTLMANMYDYMAALAIARIQKARKAKDFKEWSRQEEIIHKIAKRTKRTYQYVHSRAKGTLRKIEKVKQWSKKMEIWNNKHLGGENEGK